MRTKIKDLAYYMALPYRILLYLDDSADGLYWAAEIVELKGCAGHGNTPEEALSGVRQSMRYWLESALEHGSSIPEPGAESYSGKFVVRVPKAVHRNLIHRADREGVSLNSWIGSVLSRYGT